MPEKKQKQKQKQKIILDFVKYLEKSLRKIGVVDFEGKMADIIVKNKKELIKNNKVVNFIIACVLDEFTEYRFSVNDLRGFERRGMVSVARQLAIVIMKEQLKISSESIAKYFGRHRQLAIKAIAEYRKMNAKNKTDIKFLEKHKRVTDRVVQFISEQK